MSSGVVLIAVLVVLTLFFVTVYNSLVTTRNQYKNAFSQIDVQLKRRHDLIPNLVETAKAYLKHERSTLEAVIAARNSAQAAREAAASDPANPQAIRNLSSAEVALSGMLGKFFALSESYPDLKADRTMTQLQEELTSTENRVAFARQAFNDAITTYNNAREKFPHVLIAATLGFSAASLLELESPRERQVPKVSF